MLSAKHPIPLHTLGSTLHQFYVLLCRWQRSGSGMLVLPPIWMGICASNPVMSWGSEPQPPPHTHPVVCWVTRYHKAPATLDATQEAKQIRTCKSCCSNLTRVHTQSVVVPRTAAVTSRSFPCTDLSKKTFNFPWNLNHRTIEKYPTMTTFEDPISCFCSMNWENSHPQRNCWKHDATAQLATATCPAGIHCKLFLP